MEICRCAQIQTDTIETGLPEPSQVARTPNHRSSKLCLGRFWRVLVDNARACPDLHDFVFLGERSLRKHPGAAGASEIYTLRGPSLRQRSLRPQTSHAPSSRSMQDSGREPEGCTTGRIGDGQFQKVWWTNGGHGNLTSRLSVRDIDRRTTMLTGRSVRSERERQRPQTSHLTREMVQEGEQRSPNRTLTARQEQWETNQKHAQSARHRHIGTRGPAIRPERTPPAGIATFSLDGSFARGEVTRHQVRAPQTGELQTVPHHA